MGRALALIFTGCGIMLLLNFCIFFLVDNVRKNRNRNRGSIIRKRLNRTRKVSFSEPLVIPSAKSHKVQSISSQPGEEIEMVDLGPRRGTIPVSPSHQPTPSPVTLPMTRTTPAKPVTSLTRQRQPSQPAPTKLSRPTIPPPSPPKQNVHVIQCATLPRQIQPVRRAPPVPVSISAKILAQPTFALDPLAPSSLTRSMSVRQPHRDSFYKTFTIIIILS